MSRNHQSPETRRLGVWHLLQQTEETASGKHHIEGADGDQDWNMKILHRGQDPGHLELALICAK